VKNRESGKIHQAYVGWYSLHPNSELPIAQSSR
jgi:hypothetical protein